LTEAIAEIHELPCWSISNPPEPLLTIEDVLDGQWSLRMMCYNLSDGDFRRYNDLLNAPILQVYQFAALRRAGYEIQQSIPAPGRGSETE